MKRSFLVFVFLCLLSIVNAQPHITGTINISVQKGTIECDLAVTNLPRIKDYFIFLNSGLNIRYFRKMSDSGNYYYDKQYDDSVSDESFGYYIPDTSGKAKFLPRQGFRINYVGQYPVIADTLKAYGWKDWKGNIAFNGKTIRATEQSVWYPVLYDIKNDRQYTKVSYDVNITCSDCQSIYLNGSSPVAGTSAHLKSDSAVELLLFCGNYKIDSANRTYFLNTTMDHKQLEEFGKMTDSFKKYYEQNLLIPYTTNITYVQTTPVSKYNGFLFVTYPSITAVGWDNGFGEIFGTRGDKFKAFLAHELGHFYFGGYRKFNSELGDMIDESYAEFLSFTVTKHLIADTTYQSKIKEDIKYLKDFKAVPIGKIVNASDRKDRDEYVYVYFPLILTAIEKEIGEDKMWKWMRLILTTKTEFTNYAFLKNTLGKALNDDTKLDSIDKKYFLSDESGQNAINEIQGK